MIVLSDASPLIHLAKLGLLSVLEFLFREVRVSDLVLTEVLGPGGLPGAAEVASAAHLRPEPGALDTVAVEEVRQEENLGLGEAATLVAAVRLSADLVIIDDRRAREAARRMDLRFIGTLRVLEMGYEAGAIADLRAVYEDVVRQQIRIAPRLLDESLARHSLTPL